jgi:O-succinylbenzoate synthase
MKLDFIELRQINLPYLTPFETSFGQGLTNNSIIVKLVADGVVGWGESAVMDGPWYNEETSNSALVVMRDHLAPMLLAADLQQPQDADKVFAPVRGNRLGRSGLEFAVWDLFAKMAGKSLSQMLGGTRDRVAVGVSVGIQKDIDTLLKVVGGYVEAGYARVKLKIKPGWDVEPTRAVRQAWPHLKLQVDANSIYTLQQAAQLAKLDDFNLLLIEQPLAHDDIFDHAKLQKHLKTPVCLDESIVSPEHARWAIELQAAGVINIKPGRIGGFAPSIAVHDRAQAAGIPVWHGGMLETGIGRTGNVALASLPNFSLPGDISANDRYFARDIVHNPFTLNADSTLTVPTAPGCGAEVDEAYLEAVTVQKLEFRK